MSHPVRLMMMAAATVAAVSACNQDADVELGRDPDQVARGGDLYQQYCSSCHRSDLSGDPNWKTPNDDGSYPPPPHDSSGHTWHHPDRVLIEVIRDGSDFPQSRMPAFRDRLSEDDIGAVLMFLKENWGPEERAFQEQQTEQDQSK